MKEYLSNALNGFSDIAGIIVIALAIVWVVLFIAEKILER